MYTRSKTNHIIYPKNVMPFRYGKYSSNLLTGEGKAVNLLHKREEDYQLIGSPPPKSTYQKYKSSIERQTQYHHSIKDSKANYQKDSITRNIPMTNNYFAKKPASIRESPFKVIEKKNPASTNNNLKGRINSKENIFTQNIPKPEWLISYRKRKEKCKNDPRNEHFVLKIQTIWRGYELRKRLFNDLKLFFRANQFMCLIEHFERKYKQRKCFDVFRYFSQFDKGSNTNEVYTKNTISVTKSNTYIQELNSREEALKYRNKLLTFLLKRMLKIKAMQLDFMKQKYFRSFYLQCIQDSQKLLLNINANTRRLLLDNQFSSINTFETNRDYMSTTNTRKTQEHEDLLVKQSREQTFNTNNINMSVSVSIRKHLKLFSIYSTYKTNHTHYFFLKWKENSSKYSDEEIKQFTTLYYIKVLIKSMYNYYSRRTLSYFQLWLTKALLIRRKAIKSRYAGMVLLHKLFNSITKKIFILPITTALITKDSQ